MPKNVKHQQIKTDLLIECIEVLKQSSDTDFQSGRSVADLVKDLECELSSNRNVSTEVIALESELEAYDLGFKHATQGTCDSKCPYDRATSEFDYYGDGYHSGAVASELVHTVKS